MRKLLLATAVAMGASLGGLGVAEAQVSTIPTLLPGTSPFGGPTVAPGTVVIRLGGRLEFFGFEGASSDDKGTYPTTATGANAPFAGQSYKQQHYYFGNYVRLYPSVDGVAANGLQYGAFAEIRHENYTASGGGGGGGVNAGSGGSSASAGDRADGLLYVRRAYAYLGAPAFGTVRLGTTDGPSSLFQTGTFENFNDGAWNGDVVNSFGIAGSAFGIAFADVGILYATNKAVYLSPNFYGFDFGAAWEPTPNGVNDYDGGFPSTAFTSTGGNSQNCADAEPGCDRLSSSSSGNAARRKNFVDIAGRYRATFGPVGVAAQLGWLGSQHVGTEATTTGTPGPAVRYNGYNIGDAGLVFTVAGVSVGGHISGGDFNGQWALKPVGASKAIIAFGGVSYTVGPLIVGASFFQQDDSGSSGPLGTAVAGVGQRRQRGVSVGGTYTLAPGLAVFVDYLNGNIKENGVNLLGDGNTVTGPNGGNLAHNQLNANGIGVGTFVRW